MTFNFLANKRIHKDISQYYQSDLNTVGIHCHINEENIKNVKAMIIGPKDTPYENGFYFFDINFEQDYPFSPPKVKFLTYESGVRFNPNLYTNGKVCLSILGTWSGPGWTTCLNLNTVLLSIQSLLNENPLQNEPGFDNDTSIKSKNYARFVSYFNIKTATLKMMKTPPTGFEMFKPIMKEYFINNIDFYRDYLTQALFLDNKHIYSRVYSMSTTCEIKNLMEEIENRYNKYKTKETPPVQEEKALVQEEKALVKKEKASRKSPNEPAKQYEIGFIKLSENDENMYKVVEVSGPKRTMKRWVKVK